MLKVKVVIEQDPPLPWETVDRQSLSGFLMTPTGNKLLSHLRYKVVESAFDTKDKTHDDILRCDGIRIGRAEILEDVISLSHEVRRTYEEDPYALASDSRPEE